MRRKFHWVAVVLCLQAGLSASSRADSFTTNIFSGVSTNVAGNYIVGDTGSFNYLEINNGGSIFCVEGILGNTVSASNNSALVTGSNSSWNTSGFFYVGDFSSGNQLIISNATVVNNAGADIGGGFSTSNNTVLVVGSNSLWQINNLFYVDGVGSTVTVTNGARVNSKGLTITGSPLAANNRNVLTVTDGSVWSNSGALVVGDFSGGSGNELRIEGGSQVVGNTNVTFSNHPSASNGVLTVTGKNSLFSSSGAVTIGQSGAGGHHITVSNGAALVTSGNTSIGVGGNVVSVTGTGSVWSSGRVFMGGPNNLISISDGAYASNSGMGIGDSGGTPTNDLVLISGPGTRMDSGSVDIGTYGLTGNALVVSNGAVMAITNFGLQYAAQVTVVGTNTTMVCHGTASWQESVIINTNQLSILDGAQLLGPEFILVGGDNNRITIAGNNARWSGIGQLALGQGSGGNRLTVGAGGIVEAAQIIVGFGVVTGNLITVAGSLAVTNHGGGLLQLPQQGKMVLQQGIVTVDLLTISAGAAVTGCGTIVGNISNSGTLAVDCSGGTLTISGTVTNNGSVIATNSADIEFLGPVVNNGTINVINGSAHFPGGFINHGSYQDAGTVLTTPGVNLIGSDLVISFGCVSGKTYAVEYVDDLMSTNWVALVDGVVATGGTTQITDTAAANLPQRFYRVHLYQP